jgi:ligand-binding SRPBCC domain-containing protein
MQIIQLETRIAAPPERCFLLSLSIDLHMESTAPTRERAIAGVTQGLIGLGETVTWQGRHFGFMLTHETQITRYDRPRYFQDVMVRGMFRTFEHDHHFQSLGDSATLMRDELRLTVPFGPIGWLAESLVLRRYLARFLAQRNMTIKHVAEAPEDVWARFLDSSESEIDRTTALTPPIVCDHPDDVAEVRALSDFRLHIRFFDGTEGTVDMQALIHSPGAGVFAVLADPARFAEAGVQYGAVTWPSGPDLAPDAMYAALREHGIWKLD